MKFNAATFASNRIPYVLDGAMGSYLQMKGFVQHDKLWSTRALLENPSAIFNIHKDYITSGADIITTNTFRTNPLTIEKTGIERTDSKTLVSKAVELAREAISGREVILAGSNAPAEDCYKIERTVQQKELIDNHHRHLDYLIESGVDIIWNETFSHLDEIVLICDYCYSQKYPFTINLFVHNNASILSGESIDEVVKLIKPYHPLAIGINCISPATFSEVYKKNSLTTNWGFYLNCGAGSYNNCIIETGVMPDEYKIIVSSYLKYNPLYIGSCCGSTPDHTKKIKELVLEFYSD